MLGGLAANRLRALRACTFVGLAAGTLAAPLFQDMTYCFTYHSGGFSSMACYMVSCATSLLWVGAVIIVVGTSCPLLETIGQGSLGIYMIHRCLQTFFMEHGLRFAGMGVIPPLHALGASMIRYPLFLVAAYAIYIFVAARLCIVVYNLYIQGLSTSVEALKGGISLFTGKDAAGMDSRAAQSPRCKTHQVVGGTVILFLVAPLGLLLSSSTGDWWRINLTSTRSPIPAEKAPNQKEPKNRKLGEVAPKSFSFGAYAVKRNLRLGDGGLRAV